MPKKVIIDGDENEKEINLEPMKKGRSLAVDNIYFEFGKAYLRKESLNILDKLVKLMERNRDLKLEVQGHTDSMGPREVNMKLSRQRARAVVEYMVKQGISPSRLDSKGFGPDKPVADNDTAGGRKKNRRTEFLILEE
jgi:outer membrane protein OmpA-like peptidoglycan-associated protein